MANRKSICLGCVPGATNDEKLANAAAAGFAAVEASGLGDASARTELAALYKKYSLICPSIMGSGAWQYPGTSPDPEVRAKSADCLKNSVLTAEALGCDTVLVVPGIVSADISYKDAWDRAHETLRSVIPFAADHGVYLAVENVWNKFLLSSREMAEFIDSFASGWIKAYFDVGNILLYGYPQHWIKELGGRIKKVHIKGFKREGMLWTSLLEGDVDWKAVMQAFGEIGYDGWLTAELGPDKRGIAGIAEDMNKILAL